MISFVKFAAVFSVGLMAVAALAAKTDDTSTPKPGAKDAGDKKAKKKGDGKGEKKTVDVPVPKGHDAKGLRIPYFDGKGKLQMNFVIGVASRIDDNHVRMTDLQVETFNEAGEHEMAIDLPTSVLDTDTSVITTNKHVTIRRSDFELTGEAMIFNTKTKQGGLGGNVRMLIYNLQDETGDTSSGGPSKAGPSESSANTPSPK